MNHDTLPIAEKLTDLFLDLLKRSSDFADFEEAAMEFSFSLIATAMSHALIVYDDWLCEHARPAGLVIHDKRKRVLLTECGQVSFTRRSYQDKDGMSFSLLDEALSIPSYARISPGAVDMVIKDVMCDSYARAAELLCRHTHTQLSRQSVKELLQRYARPTQTLDSEVARGIFALGVAPDAKNRAETLCAEVDGTWIHLQHEKQPSTEVKVFSAYQDKITRGKRKQRRGAVHFATVSDVGTFWRHSVGRVARAYDLSSIDTIHMGIDGAAWCKRGEEYFKSSAVINHLDPWHLKRAIHKTLERGDAEECYLLCQDARIDEALKLIDKCCPNGEGEDLSRYLENNAEAIGVSGPSLGTIECDNATIFKKRLTGGRSWSKQSLSAMCTLLSLKASGDRMSDPPPEASSKIPVFGEKLPIPVSSVVESVGSGYEPPSGHIHQRGTDNWEFRRWAVDGIR